MKNRKELLKKLKKPTRFIKLVTAALFACGLTGVIMTVVFDVPVEYAYALYLFEAANLSYLIYIIILDCLKIKPRIVGWAQKYACTKKFVSDYNFRTMFYAFGSFVVNVSYAAFNLGVGIVTRETWYISLAVYYIVLSVARGTIVANTRKANKNKQLTEEQRIAYKVKIYRTAGIILLVLTAALNVMLWVMMRIPGKSFRYQGMLIYIVAVYTVIKVVMAVYNLAKVRNSEDYAVKAVRNINFTTALVAVLSLQTAVLTTYAEIGNNRATAVMGTAICILAVALGVRMIIRSTKILKKSAHSGEPMKALETSDSMTGESAECEELI